MKIVVAIKRVVDHNVKVRVNESGNAVNLAGVKMVINPFCEVALEEAVRLKEQNIASEIIAVCIGEAKAAEQLRSALALGADRAILVEEDANLSSLNVAKLLAQIVKQENPQLVLLGKQAIDSDNSQTPQMIAALTGFAGGTFVSNLEIINGKASIIREIESGLQQLELSLPAVISCDLRLNEPRYAKLPDIMKAKKKPLAITNAAELGVTLQHTITTLKVAEPKARKAGIKVSSVDELISHLKTNRVI